MADKIQDGTGTGNMARVNSNNKLDVSARVNDRIYYASRNDAKAFIIQFELTQATGGTTEGVGYFTYNGTEQINIKQFALTSEEPSGMTLFGIWKNPTTLSGGIASTPVNLNFTSNNTISHTSMENGDGTLLTISGGNSLYTFRMSGINTKIVEFYDAIIMSTNDTIAIKGYAASTGTKVRVNMMFAESVD